MAQRLRLKRISVSLRVFNILVAGWLASFTNIGFYQHLSSFSSFSGLTQYSFIFVTFLILSGFYFFILQLLSWQQSAKVLATVLIILTGFSSYFVNQLGVNINTDQIQNVVQTDAHEAVDLLSIPFLLWLIKTIVLPLALLCYLKIEPTKNIKHLFLDKLISLMVALFIIGLGLFSFYSQYAPIFRENRELKAQISPLNILSSSWSYAHKNVKTQNLPLISYGEDAHQVNYTIQQPAKIMVLVVGETARAQNFSLNGYPKMTNPELSQLDIVNFSQASSCGTQTSVSVPCMFSGMPRKNYDQALAAHREGLLDIAQRAGYQVTWIDNNSGCKGTCDRIKNYISPKDQSAYQKWCSNGECQDEVLLAALNDYLKSMDLKKLKQNQLIVLHQMGSHGPAYYKRYPHDFKKFLPACETNNIQNCDHDSLINTYDNTILYTDHIVASAIHVLQQTGVPTGLIYLSDHGESTGESGLYLHGTPYFMAPKEQTHVPFLFWTSQQWPEHQKIQHCLSLQKDHAVSQDHLFPTLLGLLNIQTKVLNPQLNLLAQCRGSI
ncbi:MULTISPECIES: phosphoethanolamine transferase [unclassified Acinetobacter]|uniref:phosphoethanolamine transferase n=1 Tax=unclassified Acinetobacter TaxID=196816 RepID=UPI0019092586|nr:MULTISPECIES: phosphoethanolamine--lipid A transferase [unclassified Acinetobacter]MBK0064950.1 phosphoethanolamine--lipid A transferase [Acinetobacter sp. S55]MBK0067359.1 phosphoethanolamine--lipid A transferase [Acinetobacter sp. S54]